MKKKYRLFLVFLLMITFYNDNSLFAQSFQWVNKATGSQNEAGGNVNVDNAGNIYVHGYSGSTSTNFSGIILNGGGGFLAKYNSSGNIIWAKKIRGNSGLEMDNSGNLYLCGLPDDSLFNVYDSSGNFLWGKPFTTPNNITARAICLDNSKNIYLAGYYIDPIYVGNDTLQPFGGGSSDVFVIKCDSSGNFIWAKGFGGTSADDCFDICTDRFQNVFITGFFQSSSITFGDTTLNNSGSTDAYVVKLTSNGTFKWARKLGTNDLDQGYAICSDINGNVFATGHYGWSFFLAKYDSIGALNWIRMASGGYAHPGSVCLDNSGNVYTTGYYSSSAIFGTISLTSSGVNDIFIVKYDENGIVNWAISAGGESNTDVGLGIIADNNGSLIMTGYFQSATANFGSLQLTNSSLYQDMFVTKISLLTSNNEINSESKFNIFPNPATEIMSIEIPTITKDDIISIYNLQGQLLLQQPMQKAKIEIDISNLAKGLYVILLNSNDGIAVKKFIKN